VLTWIIPKKNSLELLRKCIYEDFEALHTPAAIIGPFVLLARRKVIRVGLCAFVVAYFAANVALPGTIALWDTLWTVSVLLLFMFTPMLNLIESVYWWCSLRFRSATIYYSLSILMFFVVPALYLSLCWSCFQYFVGNVVALEQHLSYTYGHYIVFISVCLFLLFFARWVVWLLSQRIFSRVETMFITKYGLQSERAQAAVK